MNARMEIFGINGQSVFTQSLNIKEGFNKFAIDVSNFAEGNYLVKVEGGSLKMKPMKLLVTRS